MRVSVLMIILCLVMAGAAVADSEDVWSITPLAVDREHGTVTLRLDDLQRLIAAHNLQVEKIQQLQATSGCS